MYSTSILEVITTNWVAFVPTYQSALLMERNADRFGSSMNLKAIVPTLTDYLALLAGSLLVICIGFLLGEMYDMRAPLWLMIALEIPLLLLWARKALVRAKADS